MSQNWFANANATPRNTRNCAACFRARAIKHFSTNQKSKGANSRCHSCVASGYGGGAAQTTTRRGGNGAARPSAATQPPQQSASPFFQATPTAGANPFNQVPAAAPAGVTWAPTIASSWQGGAAARAQPTAPTPSFFPATPATTANPFGPQPTGPGWGPPTTSAFPTTTTRQGAAARAWTGTPQQAPAHAGYRARIIQIWSQHAPAKLPTVDTVLAKYRGQEAQLIAKLEKKYLQQAPAAPAPARPPFVYTAHPNGCVWPPQAAPQPAAQPAPAFVWPPQAAPQPAAPQPAAQPAPTFVPPQPAAAQPAAPTIGVAPPAVATPPSGSASAAAPHFCRVPLCAKSHHAMELSADGSAYANAQNPHGAFACDTCMRAFVGTRWYCRQCSNDHCFECAPCTTAQLAALAAVAMPAAMPTTAARAVSPAAPSIAAGIAAQHRELSYYTARRAAAAAPPRRMAPMMLRPRVTRGDYARATAINPRAADYRGYSGHSRRTLRLL